MFSPFLPCAFISFYIAKVSHLGSYSSGNINSIRSYSEYGLVCITLFYKHCRLRRTEESPCGTHIIQQNVVLRLSLVLCYL